jgi:hypothetical protein
VKEVLTRNHAAAQAFTVTMVLPLGVAVGRMLRAAVAALRDGGSGVRFTKGRAGPRTNRPLPYRVFRMIRFQMILTLTSRITTINGRKIEMCVISFLPLVSRRGYSRRLSHFGRDL